MDKFGLPARRLYVDAETGTPAAVGPLRVKSGDRVIVGRPFTAVTPTIVTVTKKPVTVFQPVTIQPGTAESELMHAVPGSPCPCCGQMVRVKRGLSAAERQRRSRQKRRSTHAT